MTSNTLPIYTHTSVLGVDIGVRHRDGCVVDRIEAYGSDVYAAAHPDVSRGLSAWARRNLFDVRGDE